MYKDGRFANLQRRRGYDREYRRRRAATETPQEKETKLECWSQRDRESTSHACSRILVPNSPYTRTQFHVVPSRMTRSHLVSYNCSRSQPGFARAQAGRQSGRHAEKAVHIIKCGARSGSPQLFPGCTLPRPASLGY